MCSRVVTRGESGNSLFENNRQCCGLDLGWLGPAIGKDAFKKILRAVVREHATDWLAFLIHSHTHRYGPRTTHSLREGSENSVEAT